MRNISTFSRLILLVLFLFLMSNSYSQTDINSMGGTGYPALTDTTLLNPVIVSIPFISASVGSLYTYQVHASGWQNRMVYSLLSHPAGMTIDSIGGMIRWTPDSLLADGLVKVLAENSVPPSDTQTFRIYIAEAPNCPDDLLLLLKLDESSGPHYADFMGYHNVDAIIPPVAVDGIVNGAQFFDSTTVMDIPDIASEFDFPANTSFSFEYWIRTYSSSTMVCLGRHRLDSEGTAFVYTGTDKDGTGRAAIELRDNGGTLDILKGNKFIADGQWHHFIAVRDAAAQRNKIYIDGILDAIDSVKFDSSFAAVVPTEINIGYLHRLSSAEPHYHFTGSLDEIAVYNRAITDSEALAYYNNGNPEGPCGDENYAPVITSLPDTVAYVNMVYSYTLVAEDIDSTDLLILSAVQKPSWLSFNWTSGQNRAILGGIPSDPNTGTYPVRLRISDGNIQRDQSFTLTVKTFGNNSPVITSSPALSATVGSPYAYVFTATDTDDTTLTLSAVQLPGWLQFNPADGILGGTPASENLGENEVVLRVSDGNSNVDQNFIIIVSSPTGLKEPESAGIHIFPVPARDYLHFSFDNPFQTARIKIINSLGNIVAIKELPAYTEKYILDVSALENGIYFLDIENNAITIKATILITK